MTKELFVALLFLLLVSCLKEPDYHSFQVVINLDFGAGFPQDKKAGAKVSLFNQTKSYTVETYTDSYGNIQFSAVEPGFYSVTVSHSYAQANKTCYLNGLKLIQVFGPVSDTIHLNPGKSGPFLIKEFYYSGKLTSAGKPYSADQYIEIVNNSNEVQYADGISVLEHESYGTGANFWANIKDTIVVKMIWTIPGRGTQVPVMPGKSIVIARNAINHKDDPNGNLNSPVNLGTADFEFYVARQPETDLDSPNVPNLEENLFVFRGSDVTFHVKGGSAIAIAKLPAETESERRAYINKCLIPRLSASGSNLTFYAKIANKYVFDAVEVVFDEAHAIYKRFPPELDAGYTYTPSGSGSGKCIRRKTIADINGKVFYQDTNNSAEDFLKDVAPEPKIYE